MTLHNKLSPVDTLLVPGRGVARLNWLEAFLPEAGRIIRSKYSTRSADAVAGWGHKPTADWARAHAAAKGLPYWGLEDGFFRSIGLGEAGVPSLSMVADDEGIYYDARQPSRLERLIAGHAIYDDSLLARARNAIDFITRNGLSKTNAGPPLDALPGAARGKKRILLVDQTLGDAAISGALASREDFDHMVSAARAENPEAQLIVRLHPAVSAGLKQGCITLKSLPSDVILFDQPCRAADMIRAVDAVYTVSSQMGFEALLHGLPVHCFGLPFYAGWGLTTDTKSSPRRTETVSLDALFASACILYSRYVDPLTGQSCALETALERLLAMRTHSDRNRGVSVALGFSLWKRAATTRHLSSADGKIHFATTPEMALAKANKESGRIVIWGGKENAAMRDALQGAPCPVVRMEDGFIRSAGLGSDFTLAASVVLDTRGIYYDATRESDLEARIITGNFAPAELEQARSLRALIVEKGVTKYNLAGDAVRLPDDGRPRILIVGQVEDDKSIALGCTDITTNLGLIEAVRRDFPDAMLIYKPHPDVVADNRIGAVNPQSLTASVDHLLVDGDIASLFGQIDRLATLSSLSGFEALLRGVKVSCYGWPFYAGWGLTEDNTPHPRRAGHRPSLETLIAATLIHYPLYVDPVTGLPCDAQHLIDQFSMPKVQKHRRLRYLTALMESLKPRKIPRY